MSTCCDHPRLLLVFPGGLQLTFLVTSLFPLRLSTLFSSISTSDERHERGVQSFSFSFSFFGAEHGVVGEVEGIYRYTA